MTYRALLVYRGGMASLFSFLISLDISLSFWLFYVVRRVEGIIGVSMGLDLPSSHASLWDLLLAQDMGIFVVVVLSVQSVTSVQEPKRSLFSHG